MTPACFGGTLLCIGQLAPRVILASPRNQLPGAPVLHLAPCHVRDPTAPGPRTSPKSPALYHRHPGCRRAATRRAPTVRDHRMQRNNHRCTPPWSSPWRTSACPGAFPSAWLPGRPAPPAPGLSRLGRWPSRLARLELYVGSGIALGALGRRQFWSAVSAGGKTGITDLKLHRHLAYLATASALSVAVPVGVIFTGASYVYDRRR